MASVGQATRTGASGRSSCLRMQHCGSVLSHWLLSARGIAALVLGSTFLLASGSYQQQDCTRIDWQGKAAGVASAVLLVAWSNGISADPRRACAIAFKNGGLLSLLFSVVGLVLLRKRNCPSTKLRILFHNFCCESYLRAVQSCSFEFCLRCPACLSWIEVASSLHFGLYCCLQIAGTCLDAYSDAYFAGIVVSSGNSRDNNGSMGMPTTALVHICLVLNLARVPGLAEASAMF